VLEYGQGTIVMEDGSTMVFADAAFTYSTLEPATAEEAFVAETTVDNGGDELLLQDDDVVLTMNMVMPEADTSSPLDLFADDNTATVQSAAADYDYDATEPLVTSQSLADTLLEDDTTQH
jgi:hypothetical protein